MVAEGRGNANRRNGRSEINQVPGDVFGIGARKFFFAARGGDFQDIAVGRAHFRNMFSKGASDGARLKFFGGVGDGFENGLHFLDRGAHHLPRIFVHDIHKHDDRERERDQGNGDDESLPWKRGVFGGQGFFGRLFVHRQCVGRGLVVGYLVKARRLDEGSGR